MVRHEESEQGWGFLVSLIAKEAGTRGLPGPFWVESGRTKDDTVFFVMAEDNTWAIRVESKAFETMREERFNRSQVGGFEVRWRNGAACEVWRLKPQQKEKGLGR